MQLITPILNGPCIILKGTLHFAREHVWDIAAIIAGLVLFVFNPITFGLGLLPLGYACSSENGDGNFDTFIKNVETFAFRRFSAEKLSITPVISFFLVVACAPYSISILHIYFSIKLGQYVHSRDCPINKFSNGDI